ncbi:MAG TPA: amino acid permease [Candidatus Stackebrandtia faecavium]|nr:amino acid permease [Candidatus Stackebrandtia faecavium]
MSSLWRTKSIEQSISDTDEPGRRLKRTLGPWDLTIFGVSVVVGAGIFTVAAETAGDYAGPAVMISFVIAAVACGLAALCYAEFASTLPVAGSAYTYSYATMGEFIAWIIGWDLVLEFSVAAGVISKGWSTYLQEATAQIGVHLTSNVPIGPWKLGPITIDSFDWGAVLLVVVLSAILAAGMSLSAKVNTVITAIKVSVVLLVIVVGAAYIVPSNWVPFVPPSKPAPPEASGLESSLFSYLLGDAGVTYGWYGVLAGASIVFFAFIGFDIVATTAEETRDPQRNMPRGILGSLAIVTVLYIGTALAITGMQKYTDLATTPDGETSTLATGFAAHGVDWAVILVSFGALIGLTTVTLVLLLGQSRVLFAMSRDRLLPASWSKTGGRGTPVRITVGIAVLVSILAGFFDADELGEMVNVGTLFAFVLVSIGVIVLRRKRPDLERGFRAPLVPLVPILAVVACVWLMLNLTALTWLRFVGWLLIGLVIYFVYGVRHAKLRGKDRDDSGASNT